MERVHWVHWLISSSRTLPFPIQINVSLLLLSATRATAKISCSMQHWSRLSARLKLHSFCFFELESGTGCSYIKPRVKTFCTCETPFILFLRTGICIRCRFKKPNQVLDAAIKSQGPKLSARVKLAQLASSIHSEFLCFRELETVYKYDEAIISQELKLFAHVKLAQLNSFIFHITRRGHLLHNALEIGCLIKVTFYPFWL